MRARGDDQFVRSRHRAARERGDPCGDPVAQVGGAPVFRVGLRAASAYARDECFQRARRRRKRVVIHVAVREIDRSTRQRLSFRRNVRGCTLAPLLPRGVVGAQLGELLFDQAHRFGPSVIGRVSRADAEGRLR